MYLPDHFKENDKREIAKLIKRFPLATLVCYLDSNFIANHIPIIHNKGNEYIGHIARANSLHKSFPNGTDALAIFKAEDSYISPNWYPTKRKTHRHVPTWNYQVVHLHGHLSFHESKRDKLSTVGKLTKIYEQTFSGEKAWKISDAPRDFMEQMLENIVAFKLKVEKVSAKSKISQNREKVDFDSVQQVMDDLDKTSLSNAMKRSIKKKALKYSHVVRTPSDF